MAEYFGGNEVQFQLGIDHVVVDVLTHQRPTELQGIGHHLSQCADLYTDDIDVATGRVGLDYTSDGMTQRKLVHYTMLPHS